MKSILIIGGSKGIGKECVNFFKKNGYSVTSVARTNADIIGDICDDKFRTYLVNNIKTDVVVNSVGMVGVPINQALMTNFTAVADLISNYYFSLPQGSTIVNISSIASMHSLGHKGISLERISYTCSKNAISDFCISLSKNRTRDIKITTIEPDLVLPTNFNEFHKKSISNENYENYKFESFTPIRPVDIATTIHWVISQPRWINICRISINNHYSFVF